MNKVQINDCLIGSSLLGTGGGGKLSSAFQVVQDVDEIGLVSKAEIDDDSLIVTAFGVGAMKKNSNLEEVVGRNIEVLKGHIKKDISFLVPVEIGPMSLAVIIYLSKRLEIPVLDGDLVGFRASPEVYLELLTLGSIDRCPIVASNNEGGVLLIERGDYKEIEAKLRIFSVTSQSKVYVCGYPMTKSVLSGYLGVGSVSFSQEVGRGMKNDPQLAQFEYIDSGVIVDQIKDLRSGFTSGRYVISTKSDVYTVIYKNENIVLLKNDEVVFTCPDSILLFNVEEGVGVMNYEENVGMKVVIYGMKAVNLWRTKEGRQLFSPQSLGFEYEQVLL